MDRKIIISVIIVLVGIVAVAGFLLQNRGEIPPVENITVNETRVTPNETRVIPNKTQVTPNETHIQTKISKEESMRISEEFLAELDIGPPIKGAKAVDATLFRWKNEYRKYPTPEDRYRDKYRTWIWNVTIRYPEGYLPDEEIYGDLWVDAQTGEVLFLLDQ